MHMIAGVLQYVAVASFAEAWIENDIPNASAMYPKVASFAEAWIEKVEYFEKKQTAQSPPSRRRGLKRALEVIL